MNSFVSTATMLILSEWFFPEMSSRSRSNTAMCDGSFVVGVSTINQRGEEVLEGTAKVAQPGCSPSCGTNSRPSKAPLVLGTVQMLDESRPLYLPNHRHFRNHRPTLSQHFHQPPHQRTLGAFIRTPQPIIWSTCRSHPVKIQSSLQPSIPSLMWCMAHSTASRAQTSQLTSRRHLETFPDRLLQDAPCPQHSLLCAQRCSTTMHDNVKTSTLRRV